MKFRPKFHVETKGFPRAGSHAPPRSQLRGGADAGFNCFRAACACGTNHGVRKCGGEGSGDAPAAGDKQLGSCAAGKMKYTAVLYSA